MAGRSRSPIAEARDEMYRAVVLDSAERVFAVGGYHAAKMQDVARAAGISLQTLYSAYSSKRELFEALHEARGSEFLEQISVAISAPGDARASMRRGVSAFVEYLVEHPDYFRVDLRGGRSWAIGDVEASPAFQAGIANWTALMRRGVAEGAFYDEDPHIMAVTAFGIMQIQLAAWLAGRRSPAPSEIVERITLQLERAFCSPKNG